MGKERLTYVDCIRGFCMILVVIWHLSFTFDVTQTMFNRVLFSFMLPLFFFLSGFLVKQNFTIFNYIESIKKRVYGQLLPTIFVGTIYILWINRPFLDVLLDINKAGYWFTLVLFEMFFVYASISLVTDKIMPNMKTYIYLILFFSIGLFSIFAHRFDGLFWWQVLDGYNLVKYTPFFIFGVLAHIHFDKFEKIISNRYILSFFIVLFIIFLLNKSKIGTAIQGYLGVMLVFEFFRRNRTFFSNSKLGTILSYVGSYTLAIYLLHYFFLDIFSFLSPVFDIPIVRNCELIILGILLLLSIVVICLSLVVEKIVRIVPPLYFFMFGALKRKDICER